jgi:type IV secretory pathway VirB6-like protein
MASLNEICRHTVDNTEHALAVAIIDLSTGLLLGVHHTIPYFSQSLLDTVAAAAVNMFRGQAMMAVAAQYAESHGGAANSLQQVQMSTANTHHFMSVVPEKNNALAVLITNKNISIKSGWAGLHATLPLLTPVCP